MSGFHVLRILPQLIFRAKKTAGQGGLNPIEPEIMQNPKGHGLLWKRSPYSSSKKTPWSQVLLLVGAGVVGAFQVGKAPPMLLSIRAEFGMSLFLTGWILSIFNVIGLLFASVAGAVADAFGHRRLLLTGICLQAVGSLAGSFAPGASFLLAARALEGLGFLTTIVAAQPWSFK